MMIFSRLFVPNFWIFWIFANASAQQLTSTLPASNHTCPGARIVFNCLITGSHLGIIVWSSPKYIGQGSFLQFTTADMMGSNKTSMINSDVTAQLVYNGDRNGTPTLESQLQLTVSNDLLSSTVSCQNGISGTERNVTFYTPSVPGRPHNAKGAEDLRDDGRCVIFLTWDAPLDYNEEDVDHYFVQSSSANNNIIIRTNETSTFVSINIRHCIPNIHISVSAVDRCGRDGPSTVVVPSTVIVPNLDASTVNVTAPTQQVTTRQENRSDSSETTVIVLSVILGYVVMCMIIGVLFIFYCCRHRLQRLKKMFSDPEGSDIPLDSIDQGRPLLEQEVEGGWTATDHASSNTDVLPSDRAQPGKKHLGEMLLRFCINCCTTEVGVFKRLLDQGMDLNIHDERGHHPLWYASLYGKRDLVELFLQYKADVNFKTKEGDERALHPASSSGHTDVVKLLVDSGAQIDNIDKDGRTALHLASDSGHTDVVKLLVDSGAQLDNKDKYGWTALHHASNSGHTDVVKLLLVDSRAQIDNKDNYGWTALHLASYEGHTDVVKLLIDSGAQVDNKDKDGRTGLHYASDSGHTDVVKLLVDSGAQIDNEDEIGWTALHHASNSGHTDVVEELLVNSGAQIDQRDSINSTALHLASGGGHTGVVKLLVDSGAQIIDNTNKYGQTALHLASYSGHTGVVKLLLGSGAQIIDYIDKYGKTALHLASDDGRTDVVELLLGSDAKIDNKDNDGWTALDLASKKGHTGVVELLVGSRAQIDNKDKPHENEHVS